MEEGKKQESPKEAIKKPKAQMGRPQKWGEKRVMKEVKALERYVLDTDRVMTTMEEFCISRRYPRSYLNRWAGNPDFCETTKRAITDAMSLCKDKFTLAMIKGGLLGKYDKTLVAFCLNHISGMKDERPLINIKASAQAGAESNAESKSEPIEDTRETRERLGNNLSVLKRYGLLTE